MLRVFFWDGVLPLGMAAAPLAADVLTGDREAVEFVSVLFPVVAFLIRLVVGYRTIVSNDCQPVTRFFQFVLFFVGLITLILFDTIMMLAYVMPQDALFATWLDVLVIVMHYLFYLATMSFAMYPGQRPPRPIPSIASHAPRPNRLTG